MKIVLKASEKKTQARNSECRESANDIVDTYKPGMTADMFVNEHVSVLYLCHSDGMLHRPTSVVEMAAITFDMIRITHSSVESNIKKLLNLGYLIEHCTYQRTLIT